MATHPSPSPSRGAFPAWVGAILVAVGVAAVTAGAAVLVFWVRAFFSETEVEFVWRRLLDEPPWAALAVPVAFALLVLLLIAIFRQRGRVGELVIGLVILIAVGAGAGAYALLSYHVRPLLSWMGVLMPLFALALFYVGLMYIKDARSIHPVWAALLGLLRTAVYGILATVFLLPGCQTFDESTSYPKVLMLFDVSGSMNTVDDPPAPGQDPATLPSRQDKIIRLLTASADPDQPPLLDRALRVTDLHLYRFGAVLDEKDVRRVSQGGTLKADQLTRWLKPNKNDIAVPDDVPPDKQTQALQDLQDLVDKLVGGTNIGGSANAAAKLENNTYLQAIVVFSDGNSNVGGDEQLQEFLTRVNNPRRTVPVFTVGVGEYRQPAGIRIEDILAPEVVRPDDKFPVRVPVIGTGLADEPFTVTLEVTRVILDDTGKPLQRDQTFVLGPKAGKFKGAGDNPTGTVEFEIDLQELKQIKAADDKAGALEGQWEFVAKVPRHAREAFAKDEHVSDPINVTVRKKDLRILLFAGGATREYQFLRTLLYREQQQKRVELSILLQNEVGVDHVDQDVDKDHWLLRFPNRRGEPQPGEKQYSLGSYDAIIAIDPDWSQLSREQLRLLKEWVDKDAGGVVFVAGPVNTYQLARPGGMDLSSLISIFPVMPKDSRLHGLNLGNPEMSHDTARPYVLHFTPAAKDFEFLKLDEQGQGPTAGWDAFFWAGQAPEPGKNPRRGFHNYYPVGKLKPDSAVIATFGGPKSTYFEDQDGKLKEQPFIVSMRFGAGKTVYLGAGEFWRMRVKTGFHERFWVKLARYVAAGGTMQKKYGNIYLPRTAAVGTINFEAKLRDPRQEPLPADSHPVVLVRRITDAKDDKAERYELKPRPVDDPREWQGYFSGSVKIKEDGKYEFKIPIPGTAESLRQEVIVRKPNPETDNVRNNFDYLYQMASEAPKVLATLPSAVRKEIEGKLKAPPSSDPAISGNAPRLFFTLATADAITKCLRQIEPKRERIKGPLYDLWDKGFESGLSVSAYTLAWGTPLAIGVLGFGILMFLRQKVAAALFLLGTWFLALVVAVSGLLPLEWPDLPIDFSFVLVAVAALLSIEWLTRKLLKLA